MEGEKKNNTKQVIAIVGIALVVLGAIIAGTYFFMLGNNKKVFNNALEKTYMEFNNTLNKLDNFRYEDLTTKPFKLETNITLDTNIEELKVLNNYDLNLALGADISKNIVTLGANLNYLNNNLYLEAKDLLDKVLILNEQELEVPNIELKKFNILNDVDILTKLVKDTLKDYLTEKDITTVKETITINKEKHNVTTYKVVLTKEKLTDFNQKLQDKITSNNDLMKDLATILNVKENEVKDAIKDNPILAENLEIVIYREGMLDNYIGGKIILDDMELDVINTANYAKITYGDFNIVREDNIYTIDLTSLDNDFKNIIIKEIDDNNSEITLNIENQSPLNITVQKDNDNKVNLTLKYEETTIKLDLNITYDVDLETLDTKNAVNINTLSDDEMNKLTTNLISIFSEF